MNFSEEGRKCTVRFTSQSGKRVEKHFEKAADAKKWLAEPKYEDEHGNDGKASQVTVDTWYEYWISEIKEKTTRFNTVRNYTERYIHNIKDVIGNMLISDVKPMRCQAVLNIMTDKGYKSSSIDQCRITMLNMFLHAVENEIIPFFPVTKMCKMSSKG